MRVFLILLTLLTICSMSYADEVGRYQAVVFSKGIRHDADSVFIIDTKEGHIWVWDEYKTIGQAKVGGGYLDYNGKVKPPYEIDDKAIKQRFKVPKQ